MNAKLDELKKFQEENKNLAIDKYERQELRLWLLKKIHNKEKLEDEKINDWIKNYKSFLRDYSYLADENDMCLELI